MSWVYESCDGAKLKKEKDRSLSFNYRNQRPEGASANQYSQGPKGNPNNKRRKASFKKKIEVIKDTPEKKQSSLEDDSSANDSTLGTNLKEPSVETIHIRGANKEDLEMIEETPRKD